MCAVNSQSLSKADASYNHQVFSIDCSKEVRDLDFKYKLWEASSQAEMAAWAWDGVKTSSLASRVRKNEPKPAESSWDISKRAQHNPALFGWLGRLGHVARRTLINSESEAIMNHLKERLQVYEPRPQKEHFK